MAFETIRGENGVDFIGTDGVDVLFALNESGNETVDAKGGNDSITVSDSSGVVGNVTIKGGDGDDTISAEGTGATFARFASADVKGGSGEDAITSAGAVDSVLRGNEGADNFFLSSNYTNTTINGNSGQDSFEITAGVSITLSNTKILGGSDNDGEMDFTTGGEIATAVDSTINGSKGVDFIQIGNVGSATNFIVFGGQDNDRITSANNNADGITYSGDLGDDIITITGTADVTVNGGDGIDRVTTGAGDDSIDLGVGNDIYVDGAGTDTVVAGEGNDTLLDGAGADTYTLGAGDDTYTDGAGADTITGGIGADTFTTDNTANDTYVISGISDSSATDGGYDDFTGIQGANTTIDISAVADILAGNTATGVVNSGTTATGTYPLTATTFSFAELTTLVDTELTASDGTGAISSNRFNATVTDAAGVTTTTRYIVFNNTNSILDAGDLLFEVSTNGERAEVFTAVDNNF